jgi:hypothetical protein
MKTAARFTLWPPNGPPVTFAVFNEALAMPPAEMDFPEDTFDIFETNAPGELELAIESSDRAKERAQDEMNMSILYYWSLMHFEILAHGGTLAGNQPSPLSAEQIRLVQGRLGKHSTYRAYTLVTFDRGGQAITYP